MKQVAKKTSVLTRQKKSMADLFRDAHRTGGVLVEVFKSLSLFGIGASVIWSAVHFYIQLVHRGYASLEDLLLLFVYLEIGAMTGIYFKTGKLPVRFLIYVAVTAIARYLVVDVEHLRAVSVLVMSISVIVLVLALWVDDHVHVEED